MTQRKILFTAQNIGVDLDSPHAMAILIRCLVAGLRQAGNDVRLLHLQGGKVVVRDEGGQDEAKLGLTGGRVFRRLEGGLRRAQRALRLPYLAVFDSFRFYEACVGQLPAFDLCHEYAGLYSLGTAVACHRAKKPYVLTVDADLLLEREVAGEPLRGIAGLHARWVARLTYRLADRLVTVSEATRERLVRVWGVPAEKITVLPNGVDLDRFQAASGHGQQVRAELGLGEAPVVMFVGGFQAWHGLRDLLVAFAEVCRRHLQARLVLVGDGPLKVQTQAWARDLGVMHAVTWTGRVAHDRVPAYLDAADVVVLPYPKVNRPLWFSPLKLFEYMAAGKAIVATSAGQVAEVLAHGETGWLVEPGDIAGLAEGIVTLLQQGETRRRLGEAARRQAAARHAWERTIRGLEAVYHDLLGRKRVLPAFHGPPETPDPVRSRE